MIFIACGSWVAGGFVLGALVTILLVRRSNTLEHAEAVAREKARSADEFNAQCVARQRLKNLRTARRLQYEANELRRAVFAGGIPTPVGSLGDCSNEA